MNPAFIRVGLRYVAGYLVIKNLIPPEIADLLANDPDIVVGVGVALTVAVEGAYALAKKLGWRT